MRTAPASRPCEEYDRQYQVWVERQGPRALDLDWRLTHLLWRHRALLRRYSPEGKRVLDFGCMDGVFTLRLQQLGGEAVGYDISPAAIAQAKRFRGPAARPGVHHRAARPRAVRPDLLQRGAGARGGRLGADRRAGGLPGVRAGRWWERRRWGQYFWDPDHKRSYDEALLQAGAGALGTGAAASLLSEPAAQLRPPPPGRRRGVHLRGYAAVSSGRTLIASVGQLST